MHTLLVWSVSESLLVLVISGGENPAFKYWHLLENLHKQKYTNISNSVQLKSHKNICGEKWPFSV